MSMSRKDYNRIVTARNVVIDEAIDSDMSFSSFLDVQQAFIDFAHVLVPLLEADNPTIRDKNGIVIRQGFDAAKFLKAMKPGRHFR